jgi:hypothetical protein
MRSFCYNYFSSHIHVYFQNTDRPGLLYLISNGEEMLREGLQDSTRRRVARLVLRHN